VIGRHSNKNKKENSRRRAIKKRKMNTKIHNEQPEKKGSKIKRTRFKEVNTIKSITATFPSVKYVVVVTWNQNHILNIWTLKAPTAGSNAFVPQTMHSVKIAKTPYIEECFNTEKWLRLWQECMPGLIEQIS
jgi:hypothetical protein